MFERWMMSQFDRLLRCVSVSSVVFRDCPHVVYVMLRPPKLQAIAPRLRLVCFPVFGSVDHFRDVSVRTADIRWELFILIAVYQLCLEGRLVQRLVRDGVVFCDIILGTDWLSRHQVLLDCLRARFHISGAEHILIAYILHAEELLDMGSKWMLVIISMLNMSCRIF
ncbi:hypothetical protein YC2023_039966 [Brassica napus]